MMRTLVYNLCALVLLSAMALLGSTGDAAAQAYTVKPGDIVEVTVIEDPSLNRRVLVGPDGRISVPLAGSIDAAGRTLSEIQTSLQTALAPNFVRPPTITAALVALGPPPLPDEELEEMVIFSVYLVGEVNRPGRYEYDGSKPISVLQALALAGGPGIFADRDAIQVRSYEDGTETISTFDYDAVENGLYAGLGLTLPDGAIIVVPERGVFD